MSVCFLLQIFIPGSFNFIQTWPASPNNPLCISTQTTALWLLFQVVSLDVPFQTGSPASVLSEQTPDGLIQPSG